MLKDRELAAEAADASDHLTLSQWLADTLLRWRLIAFAVALAFAAAAVAVLLIPPIYRTEVSFVVNNTSGSMLPAGALGVAGPLAGLATQFGAGSRLDPSESPNFYVELIRSRELVTRLLESKFRDPRSASPNDSARLIDILHLRGSDPQRRMEKGIKKMSKAMNGSFDVMTNVVFLDVNARWPDLSAAIANRTIELVSVFNSEQRVSRVRSKRVFLETRVAKARSDMDAAENRIRVFNEQNRSWRAAPALVLEEQHLQRELDRTADLYLGLQRQYESTLLDEVNDAARITVIDAGVTPRKAMWPDYTILAVAIPFAGLFLGFMVAGAAAVQADWRRRNPRSAGYLSSTLRRVKGELGNAFRRSRARKVAS